MKAKEFILLILILAAGIFFYHAYTGRLNYVFDIEDFFIFSPDEYVYEDTQELKPPFPPELQITNTRGSIEIQGTDEETITISLQKRIRRRNEEDASEIAKELKMIIHRDSHKLSISTNRGKFRRKNFRTSFRISLPQGMDVRVKNSYGLVNVSKVGNTDITNPNGKIVVSDISGELIAQNSYRDIDIENVQLDCQLESENSTVFITGIKGKTDIIHSYGKIHLENLSQDVKIDGSHSEIFGQNLLGSFEVETSYRKIVLFDVGPTKIKGYHTGVEVEDAKEYLDVKNKYGKIKLTNIKGDLNIDGEGLSIYGKSIVGQKIYISTAYRDIELSDFSGKTTIIHSNGEIVLEPLPLTYPIEVKGEYSDIKFYWPLEGKYPFEAQAKNGDIKWRLPVEFSYEEENGISTVKAFLEEKENPSIFLSTSYNTIRIEE